MYIFLSCRIVAKDFMKSFERQIFVSKTWVADLALNLVLPLRVQSMVNLDETTLYTGVEYGKQSPS